MKLRLRLAVVTLLWIAALTAAPVLFAQIDRNWQVFSALDRTNDLTMDPKGNLWVATGGGAYSYDPVAGTSIALRTDDGLLALEVLSIGVNPDNRDVYFGHRDGGISILRSGGWWTYVLDIKQAASNDRRILGFAFGSGKTYILTAFGVAVFDPSDSTISESWTRFNGIDDNAAINDLLIWNDSVWLATENGLAVAPATGVDLADPLQWKAYDLRSICGSRTIALAVIDGALNVGTDNGVCRYNGGAFLRRDDVDGTVRLATNGANTAAANDNRLFVYEAGAFRESTASAVRITSLAILSDGRPVVGYERGGVGIRLAGTDSLVAYVPPGPAANDFLDIAYGFDAAIWTVSNQNGISRLRDGEWTLLNSRTLPIMGGNQTRYVSALPNGEIWVGNYGEGYLVIVPEGDTFTVRRYDETNTPLRGISTDQSYIIGGDVVTDSEGRIWFVNYDDTEGIRGGVLLSKLLESDAAGEFKFFAATSRYPNLTRGYPHMVIDANDTKWLGSDNPNAANGLLFYNEGESIQGPGMWGLITTANGLPSNRQSALLVDPDNEIWIGTPNGLVVLVNPTEVLESGASAAVFRQLRALKDIYIRAIEVDALNRKWVGTDNGIFVMSSDGLEVLQRFTVANSPLVSDEIRSILAVGETGEVYVGTTNGLNRIETEAVTPGTVETLSVSPQPFVAGVEERLRIEGLPPSATVKILTVAGTLVREFPSPGGAIAFWDGLDASGNPAPPGVYIVAGQSPSGETTIGKVAVVAR